MTISGFQLKNDYWDDFALTEKDIETLYNALLEMETPLPAEELARLLVTERITLERLATERRKSEGGDIYLPKNRYETGQTLIFPAFEWERGVVASSRPGYNPEMTSFDVITVEFETGPHREFATGLEEHPLNSPIEITEETGLTNPDNVLLDYGPKLTSALDQALEDSDEFVRIAGRWFPRALLVEINTGHLNLAEAMLDMEGGGPLSTAKLLETVDLGFDMNKSLVEFSFDFALWKDERFDEVGAAGKILWHLKRLEPPGVLETPKHLRYAPIEYDPNDIPEEMIPLEAELDDELSRRTPVQARPEEVEIRLIYPHWRAGTLPLSGRLLGLFPTAYQAPRIRFILEDGETGEQFPGWIVREAGYVFGLKDFYADKHLFPGGLVKVRRGRMPGEVIVEVEQKRETREWLRTVLAGSDGGLVLAMLKQFVRIRYDERMAIAVPEPDMLDRIGEKHAKDRTPFERIVVNLLRELAKLNPQANVHASELYAAVNLVRRAPPGPILALLNTRPWFQHVGDLYFKLDESAN
ncbi:MAG TPA: hypothetical protein VMN57_06640 [Anaerolineales bacterium]|nr:hypothetical protein [Anaerolineales bacterium]